MASYIAVIHKDEDSDYGVSFPDFPGCISAGSTLDEAKDMAQEALAFHVETMIEDGDPIPEPSSLDAVMSDPDYADGVAFLVAVPEPRPRSKRINVTIQETLLHKIDAEADYRGLSRSAFLAAAAQEAIERRRA